MNRLLTAAMAYSPLGRQRGRLIAVLLVMAPLAVYLLLFSSPFASAGGSLISAVAPRREVVDGLQRLWAGRGSAGDGLPSLAARAVAAAATLSTTTTEAASQRSVASAEMALPQCCPGNQHAVCCPGMDITLADGEYSCVPYVFMHSCMHACMPRDSGYWSYYLATR